MLITTVLSMSPDMFSLNEDDIEPEVDVRDGSSIEAKRSYMRYVLQSSWCHRTASISRGSKADDYGLIFSV